MAKYKSVPISASGSKLVEIKPRQNLIEEQECQGLLVEFCDKGDMSGINEHLKYYDLSAYSYSTVVQNLSAKGNIPALRILLSRTRTEWQTACLQSLDMFELAVKKAVRYNQTTTVAYLDKLFNENEKLKREFIQASPHSKIKGQINLSKKHANIEGAENFSFSTYQSLPISPSVDMAQLLFDKAADKEVFICGQIANWHWADNRDNTPEQEEVFKFWVQSFVQLPDISQPDKEWFINSAAFIAATVASRNLVDYLLYSPQLPFHAKIETNFAQITNVPTSFEFPENFWGYKEKAIEGYQKEDINSLFFGACVSRDNSFLNYVLQDINPEIIRPHAAGVIQLFLNGDKRDTLNANFDLILECAAPKELDIAWEPEGFRNSLYYLLSNSESNPIVQTLLTAPHLKTLLPVDHKDNILFREAAYSNNTDMIKYLISKHKVLEPQNKIKKFFSSFIDKKSLFYFIRENMTSFSEETQDFLTSYETIQKEKKVLETLIKPATKSAEVNSSTPAPSKKRLNKI